MVKSNIFRYFIYTNFLIALSALSQCTLTYLLFQIEVNYFIILIEGCSTLLLYNFSLLLAKPKQPKLSIYPRTKWVFSHLRIFYFNSLICLLVLGFCLLHISRLSFGFLMLIGVLSMLYSLPLLKYKGKGIGLRNVPYVKLFHIALIWTLSSVMLPAIECYAQGVDIVPWKWAYLVLMKFILLLICTLPFDIRDAKQDALYKLKTIPTYFGVNRSRRITYLLLVGHSFLVLFSPFLVGIKIGLLVFNVLICWVLKFYVFKENADYHNVYLLDFMLFVQLFVVFFFSWVSNAL